MNPSSNRKFAIGVTAGAALVFLATFLPWGLSSSRFVKAVPESIQRERPVPGDPAVVRITLPETITAWNSYLSVGVFDLPNWAVVLAAVALTALSWLKAASVWNAPTGISLALAAYGLLHAGSVFVLQLSSRTIEGGALEEGGALLAAVAFAGILVVLVRQVQSARSPGAVQASGD